MGMGFYHALSLMERSVCRAGQGYLVARLHGGRPVLLAERLCDFLSYHASLRNQSPPSVDKFCRNRLSRIYPLHIMLLSALLLRAEGRPGLRYAPDQPGIRVVVVRGGPAPVGAAAPWRGYAIAEVFPPAPAGPGAVLAACGATGAGKSSLNHFRSYKEKRPR